MADIEGIRSFLEADETGWNKGFKSATKTVDKFVLETGKKLEKTGRVLTSAGKSFSVAFTAPIVLFARSANAASLELARMQTRMEFATGSAEAAAIELEFVSQTVDRLGVALLPSIDGFSKFAAAAKGTSAEGQVTRDVFTGMSQAAATLGLTSEQTSGAFTALEQIMSKGKVQAEELRGQLGERLPGAFQIAARAMDVTTQELNKMLEMGEVVSDVFLPKFAAELTKTFTDTAPLAVRSVNALANSMLRLKKEVGDIGLTKGMIRIRLITSELIDSFVALDIETKKAAFAYTAIAAAIGPVLLIGGSLLLILGKLVSFTVPLRKFMLTAAVGAAGIVVPLGAAAVAVALLWAAFGDLLPSMATIGKAAAWLQGIMGETASFWGAVASNILDNTKILTDGQQKGVGIIAKAWLALKVTWKIIVVAMQDTVIGLAAVVDGLVLTMATLAAAVGLDSVAAGYKKTSATIQDFVFNLNQARVANEKAAQGLIDSWDKAPALLRADVKEFTGMVSELGDQALEMLESKTPDAVKSIIELIKKINEQLAAGEAGTIEVPITYGTEAFGPKTKPAADDIFGAGGTSGLAFLRQRDEAMDAANNTMLQKQFEVLAALADSDRMFISQNLSDWQMWKQGQADTLSSWRANALGVASDIKGAIADNLAATIVAGKSFSRAMISTFQTMGQRLISMAIDNALTRILIDESVAIANGAASAPSPILIPLFVGLAIAGFSAAMSGTMFGSSGGSSGGAVSAPAAAAVAPEAATVSRIEDSEDIQGGGDGILRVVVESEFEEQLMSFAVRAAKNGAGDGVDRFLTTADV